MNKYHTTMNLLCLPLRGAMRVNRKSGSATESGAGRCRVNLEPMALFRTDSDHVELDKVPNHGRHPMIFVHLVFGYMAVYSFRLLN